MRKPLVLVAFALLFTIADPVRAQFCPGAAPWVFDDVPAGDLFCGLVVSSITRGPARRPDGAGLPRRVRSRQ